MRVTAPLFARTAALLAVTMFTVAGCKKTADNTSNYKSAINDYYSAHPACLWSQEIKFPVQVKTSDDSKTKGYDALVDQGLLSRTTDEKKKMIILSEQVTNYDLTDKGRSAWTADASNPGYGNLCVGHRSVSTIDSASPTDDKPGATTDVSYHYSLDGVPDWAKAPETQTAYPDLRDTLSGSAASSTAKLTDTQNGWRVTDTPGMAH
jgi:hypothetical protein